MYTLYAKVHFKIELQSEGATHYTQFSNDHKRLFGYSDGQDLGNLTTYKAARYIYMLPFY
jgi:hypothetical protein